MQEFSEQIIQMIQVASSSAFHVLHKIEEKISTDSIFKEFSLHSLDILG